MALFSGNIPNQDPHPVLRGFSSRALNAVYNAGSLNIVKPGEQVFEAPFPTSMYALVLEGNGTWHACEPVEPAHQGQAVHTNTEIAGATTADLISPLLLQRMERINHVLSANVPMRLLTLDEAAITSLAPEIQAHFYRNLCHLSNTETSQLQYRLHSRIQQQQLHVHKLAGTLQQTREQYSSSAAIRLLLQKVPRLPPYASKLTTMLMNNQISAREVAAVARLDPSLTASVLKTVNSAYFGLTHKVMNFHHAFVLLGFNQIYQVVMHKGIQSTLPGTADFAQLQFHSILISVLCHEISLTLRQGVPALLSTLGLLHDIGKSMVLLMKRQQPKQAFLINLLAPDIVGAMLLREWNIPDEICGSLEYMTLSELAPADALPAEYRTNLTVLNLAHACADFLAATSDMIQPDNFSQDQFRALGCRSLSVEDFVRNKLAPAITSRGNKLPRLVVKLIDRKLGPATTKARQGENG